MVLAIVAAHAAAIAFHPAMSWRRGGARFAAYLACAAGVALAPCIAPAATIWRGVAALVAVALFVKLYDLERSAVRGMRLNFREYLLYLPNWFWLALRLPPRRGPWTGDCRALAVNAAGAIIGVAATVIVFLIDWRSVPFLLEHAAKVSALAMAVINIGNGLAAAMRLSGGRALVVFRNPFAADTPADLWRRWNRPTQQFLHEHVYRPLHGPEQPVSATVVTFAISALLHEGLFDLMAGRVMGWQLLFFMIHGVAVVATSKVRPRGAAQVWWTAGTFAFAVTTTALFGLTMNAVVPVYVPRGGR